MLVGLALLGVLAGDERAAWAQPALAVSSPSPHSFVVDDQTTGVSRELVGFETFVVVSVNTGEEVVVEMSGPLGEPSEASMRALQHQFRCLRTREEASIAPALVALLARLARELGGRLELVSGYRAPLYSRDHSFHTRGEAADIRVPGWKAFELREVARKLGVPGLGVYPASGMIHVDVRETPFRWTDWTGPARAK